ncbi:unnamed protein product [Clonostachys rhizophaga]|uniref:Uncharacterized protein n=1 Tax=Clonostachys rhizophaga TaxID=160324 RepID=A0A9N9V6Y2_9HYPO|nr:unnamed protein product [Clonostachys rhizophaga]
MVCCGESIVFPDPSDKSVKASDFKIDITAVHGLNPRSKNEADHAWDTWRTPSGSEGHLWLREDLPAIVPGARIFLYQYDAAAAYGTDKGNFHDKASSLLEAVDVKRHGAEQRPILWFGHSMGGILIKQALINAHVNPVYSSIKDATSGLAFFATPQSGGDQTLVNLGRIAVAIANTVGFSTKSDVLSTLKKGSVFSDIMAEQWRHQLESYDIVSFWGDHDTAVPRESARLGLAGNREHIVKLNADHGGVCKFSDSIDDQDNLELVLPNIQKLYEKAMAKCESVNTRENAVTEQDAADIDFQARLAALRTTN